MGELVMTGEAECEHMPGQAPSNPSRIINLGANLDITMVAQMRARLGQLLDAPGDVSLDAGELERVDAAGLQLLVAFTQHARSAALRVRWLGVSPCLEESAVLTGLAGLLELPAA